MPEDNWVKRERSDTELKVNKTYTTRDVNEQQLYNNPKVGVSSKWKGSVDRYRTQNRCNLNLQIKYPPTTDQKDLQSLDDVLATGSTVLMEEDLF